MNAVIIFMFGCIISFCIVLILTDFYNQHEKGINQDFIKEVEEYMKD